MSISEKVRNLANSKKEDDSEADEYDSQQNALAELRLRRRCLYATGARTQLPKVSKNKNKLEYESPYQLSRAMSDSELHDNSISSSVPPGAHSDQFRIIRYPTEKSMQDPDRVFYTTTSYTEGIERIPQPPWYFGSNNKTKPPDSHAFMTAARYGYRGSRDIQQFHIHPYESPQRTRTQYTPKFLTGGDIIDEWTPPIVATTSQTINNIETPKLWPENTEFVSGFQKKKTPTSSFYNRETTIGLPIDQRPQTSDSLDTVLKLDDIEKSQLISHSHLESTLKLKSLPQLSKEKSQEEWEKQLKNSTNNKTITYTMKKLSALNHPMSSSSSSTSLNDFRPFSSSSSSSGAATTSSSSLLLSSRPPSSSNPTTSASTSGLNPSSSSVVFDSTTTTTTTTPTNINNMNNHSTTNSNPNPISRHTLLGRTDSIQYSSSTAMIVRTQSAQEMKFRYHFERNNMFSQQPLDLKWNQMEIHYKTIKSNLKKDQNMSYVIFDIGMKWKKEAMILGNPTSFRRQDFIMTCSKMEFLSCFPSKTMSLIYTILDPLRVDHVRFIEYLSCLTILDSPTQETIEKLSQLWVLYMDFGCDASPLSMALEIMKSCCVNEIELQEIERLFRLEFRSLCVQYATGVRQIEDEDVYQQSLEAHHNQQQQQQQQKNNHNHTLLRTKKNINNVFNPQYNICDDFLNQATFLYLIRQCPELLSLFDSLLTCRLVNFYGKDARNRSKKKNLSVLNTHEGGGGGEGIDSLV